MTSFDIVTPCPPSIEEEEGMQAVTFNQHEQFFVNYNNRMIGFATTLDNNVNNNHNDQIINLT